LTVAWRSDLDGDLGTSTADSDGTVSFAWASPSAGTHTLSLLVTDELGVPCTTSIRHTVGTPPGVSIELPLLGEVVNEGELAGFSALVQDAEDAPGALMVTWTSDLDGLLYSALADASGASAFADASLSLGSHTLTVTVVDTDGQSAAATRVLVVNGLPSAPTVSISPASPLTADALTVSVDAPAVAPEGDPLTYSYAWTRDGTAAGSTATVAAASTSRGKTWSVSVWANDGSGDGDIGTSSVVIGNTAPTLSSVEVTPDPAFSDSTLVCTASGYADADGDADASTYAWTIDGVAAGTGTTLAGPLAVGEVVTCTVTAFDGTSAGTVLSDSVTVENTAPTAPTVVIDPASPTADEALQCVVETASTDVDGDALAYTFSWTRDGVAFTALDRTDWPDDTVPADTTVAGEVWACTAVPDDALDEGPAATASVTIGASGGNCFASGGWSGSDTDDDGLPDDCLLSVLLVGGHGWTTDNIESTLLAREWDVDRVEASVLSAVTDFTGYDVVAVAYSADNRYLGDVLAANAAGEVGLVFHRGGSDDFSPSELGTSTYYQAGTCSVDDPTHFVTEPFGSGTLDVGYTYKTVVRGVLSTGRTLLSCTDASVVTHTTLRRLTTPYYGHDVGMPWAAEGEQLDIRSYAWAAGFGDF
jgi:hypothetical protein